MKASPDEVRTYRGLRVPVSTTSGADRALVIVEAWDGRGRRQDRLLDPCFDLWVSSPTGFEWGHGGSGPDQLAVALLAEHFLQVGLPRAAAGRRAVALARRFVQDIVGNFPRWGWELSSDELELVVDSIEESLAADLERCRPGGCTQVGHPSSAGAALSAHPEPRG